MESNLVDVKDEQSGVTSDDDRLEKLEATVANLQETMQNSSNNWRTARLNSRRQLMNSCEPMRNASGWWTTLMSSCA